MVALTVNDCVVGGATINGYSMQPTLNPGDYSGT
jgi:signal peptidase I